MLVRSVKSSDVKEWLRMRNNLWPNSVEDNPDEITQYFEQSSDNHSRVFVAEKEPGTLVGFLELSIRSYAEGCLQGSIPYIEGWYVDAGYRRKGIGAMLVANAESWAVSCGYRQIASDTETSNQVSISAHKNLGYLEVDKIVCFKKDL
ncbi:GNAT family N-acetyltransferase [Aliikangiella marina]|uniref:Aminoglycoside N(6')-acetyltransferase type 1 n=1 Tax=Aliikangiella marina TaxID=1712262 RepID=A0A545TDG1_9GAMM|nr:GNAT family N-acetyltransferase [Aliikangiella marina]TQV75258.1 GNAT family N-acetyltransferase [Aliikangiella marina]